MAIEIFGDDILKKDVAHLTPHVGARGIVRKDDLYLLVHLKKDNLYTLPGGGVEEGETLEDAVVREVKEETGYVCNVVKKGVVIKEYFSDSIWHNHYFVLDIVGQTETSLTKEEISRNLLPVWKTIEEVYEVLTNYASNHEYVEAISNREFLGFTQSL